MLNATIDAVPAGATACAFDRPERPIPCLAGLRRLPEVESLVEGFVASWHSSAATVQSRRWHRVRYEKRLLITPLDEVTERVCGEAFDVMGRDISLTGVSFIHRQPLAPRKVAVTFLLDDGSSESVVAILRWCRFRRDACYQSGGQFLRAIAIETAASTVTGSLRSF